MKRTKALLLFGCSIFALAIGFVSFGRNNNLFLAGADEECAHHHGNYYLAKAPTVSESGWHY